MKDGQLKYVLLGLMIFSFTVLKSQDPQFSQFYNTSLYYNPATAGITRDLRFSSSFRKQWSKIPGDLSTYFLSADYQWSKTNMGIGFLMLNDNEGLHHLRTQRVEFIYSYRIQKPDRMLQFGMSIFSLNKKDFKNNGFVFSDQLDPIYGVVQPSSFAYEAVEPKVYPDWNIGVVYRQNFIRRKITPTIGFSASHIFRPYISFVDNDNARLPRKYVVHANLLTQLSFSNGIFRESKVAFLNPGFVYEFQKPFQTFTAGSGFNLDPFRLGLWFRSQSFYSELYKLNSVIITAGFVLPLSSNRSLTIDYTYDSTVSKLEFASGGAHEITLIYNMALTEKEHAIRCYNEWWRDAGDFVRPTKK